MCDVRMERAASQCGVYKVERRAIVLSEMYLVGSIPLLVYRRDMASCCVTPFYYGVLLRNTKKASIVSVVSTLVSLTTNQVRAYILTCYFSYVYTTHTKRHIHNTERRACTHTHTHIHTQNSHTYTQWSLHALKLAKKVDIQTDVD